MNLKYLLASLNELTANALEDTKKIENQRDDLMKSSWDNAMFIEDKQIKGYYLKSFYDHPEFRWVTTHLFYSIQNVGLGEEKELKKTLEHLIELIS